MRRRDLIRASIVGLVIALLGRPAQAQFTDAQKVAFANMEISGFRALGLDSNVIQRIVRWHRLGNTVQARAMMELIYKNETGLNAATAQERHEFKHWVESRASEEGGNYE